MTGVHAVTGGDLLGACPWCRHPYDPHVFVARSYALFGLPGGSVLEVPDGGTVSCPVPGTRVRLGVDVVVGDTGSRRLTAPRRRHVRRPATSRAGPAERRPAE